MAGVLSAEDPALLRHLFQHVPVADGRSFERNAVQGERLLESEVAHQRADHAARHRAAPPVVERDHIQELVAVVHAAFGVNHDQSVAVAVEREAKVGTVIHDGVLQMAWMRRPDVVVDVEAIRLVADGDHLGAELMEHVRRDVVCCAVRAVDDDLQPLEIELVGKSALAEFDVAPARIVDAERLAQLLRRHAGDRAVHAALDRVLDLVGKLRPRGGKELDAVVVEGVVRRADDDARGKAQRPRQVRHCGCGQGAREIDVDAGGREPGFERRLEKISGNARVLADEHRRRIAGLALRFVHQHASRGVAEPEHQLGRNRLLTHAAAHTVGTEIAFLRHVTAHLIQPAHPTLRSRRKNEEAVPSSGHRPAPSTARQTLSASTVSRTSCTRTIAAPRATAESAAAMLPAVRSPTSRPVSAPMVDLRDRPTATG